MSLSTTYNRLIDANGMRPDLASFEESERRYGDAVLHILENGASIPEVGYVSPRAYSGGMGNAQAALEEACADVLSGPIAAEAEFPEIYCGLWPSRGLNARSIPDSAGGIVLIDVGLFELARVFTQVIAWSLSSITGGVLYGEDLHTDYQAVGFMREAVDWLGEGAVAPVEFLRVTVGPREFLRREINHNALCAVIAHEVGHLAKKRVSGNLWKDDNAFLSGLNLSMLKGESGIIESFNAEVFADLTAARVLRNPPFGFREHVPFTLLFGAMAIQSLQSGGWWRRAAYTSDLLGWSHPAPDIRRSVSAGLLADSEDVLGRLVEANLNPKTMQGDSESSAVRRVLADRFSDWSDRTFGVEKCKKLVRARGLGGRGMNPESLAFFYATDMDMRQQPSEVLQSFRDQLK